MHRSKTDPVDARALLKYVQRMDFVRSLATKAGNKYLRAALFMPAHNASKFEPKVMAFSDHLIENGKTKMQAKVAVMRKLLHAIYGMLATGTNFDGANAG